MKDILETRVTTIESLLKCPRAYKECPWEWDKKTLVFWTFAHKFFSEPLLDHKLLIDYYFNNVDKSNIDKFYLEQISEISKKFREKYPTAVYEIGLNKMFWNVFVEWTTDCFVNRDDISDDEMPEIYDFKTVKAPEYYSDFEWKMQPIFYSYFIMLLYWIKRIKFTYICIVKTSAVKIKKYSKIFTLENCEKLIKEYTTEYSKIITENNFYEKKNTFCKWCRLYKQWDCNIWKKTEISITSNQDDLDDLEL